MWYPMAWGGNSAGGFSQPSGLGAAAAFWPGLVGRDSGDGSTGTYAAIYDLMNYMAGSLNDVSQYYFVNDPSSTSWSNPSTEAGQKRFLSMNQNEYAFFFKDDWKVTPDLTLNLGIRYEYYGVPHMKNGLTIGIIGGAENIFGGQSGGFNEWLRGVPSFCSDDDCLTRQHFIGPGSPNPDEVFFNKDLNNWGPAVGFAWQLPWFGKGKTTLRGGYQASYINISRLNPNSGFMDAAGNQPGTVFPHEYGGDSDDYAYMDIAILQGE
jgi:outer membrane receptor protein involved in Fe transport